MQSALLYSMRAMNLVSRYIHDGSDVVLDTFTLALSDGLNQETKVISVDIVPIDDQSPQMSQGLRPLLIVSEGDEAVITPRSVSHSPTAVPGPSSHPGQCPTVPQLSQGRHHTQVSVLQGRHHTQVSVLQPRPCLTGLNAFTVAENSRQGARFFLG